METSRPTDRPKVGDRFVEGDEGKGENRDESFIFLSPNLLFVGLYFLLFIFIVDVSGSINDTDRGIDHDTLLLLSD